MMNESEKPSVDSHHLIDVVIFFLLLPCLALPWLAWLYWGWIAGLLGVVGSHVLYVILLKPQGICLGMHWIFVALNSILVILVVAGAEIWKLIA